MRAHVVDDRLRSVVDGLSGDACVAQPLRDAPAPRSRSTRSLEHPHAQSVRCRFVERSRAGVVRATACQWPSTLERLDLLAQPVERRAPCRRRSTTRAAVVDRQLASLRRARRCPARSAALRGSPCAAPALPARSAARCCGARLSKTRDRRPSSTPGSARRQLARPRRKRDTWRSMSSSRRMTLDAASRCTWRSSRVVSYIISYCVARRDLRCRALRSARHSLAHVERSRARSCRRARPSRRPRRCLPARAATNVGPMRLTMLLVVAVAMISRCRRCWRR